MSGSLPSESFAVQIPSANLIIMLTTSSDMAIPGSLGATLAVLVEGDDDDTECICCLLALFASESEDDDESLS